MRTLVIQSREEAAPGELATLGTREELVERLRDLNTAADKPGGDVLYGPGIILEFAPGEPVTQIMLSLVEEEIAWNVVSRLARTMEWRLLDPNSGRELSFE